ncbi:MAG: isoaspartyl peptidase/L-asparaginase [Candidatus Kapabacteria bacterium]|nr:isoaspartyl peptidase/L-asparaginase [Candidatus Kapabacteria bacterium]
MNTIAIALHGGAGDRDRSATTPDNERELTDSIAEARETGYMILEQGGTAVDAIEAAIRIMELQPCFNAGVGGALNTDGEVELDAGIIDGATHVTGAVIGVQRIKHPITMARYIMEHTPHVALTKRGAELLAESIGVEMVEKEFFLTDETVRLLHRMQEKEQAATQGEGKVVLGTVGAVALDRFGNMAAANSTGGIMNKRIGRVGDAPMNGAGMFAHNGIGAVAATGYGEFFVRTVAAHEIIAQMRYCNTTVDVACMNVLSEIESLGGRGGLIALDAHGTVVMPFTTTSMVRATRTSHGIITADVW